MKIFLRLSRVIDGISGLLGKLIPWLVLAAVLISATNAVARKAFNLSSNAFLEIQWYLFAAVFLLGAGYAFLVNAHVRIDVLAGKLTPPTRNIIDIVGILVFLLPLCGFMIHLSWPYVWQAYTSGRSRKITAASSAGPPTPWCPSALASWVCRPCRNSSSAWPS
jgi:TRAP-type mannitol/chloroaromatic compound transport system permease small subunit